MPLYRTVVRHRDSTITLTVEADSIGDVLDRVQRARPLARVLAVCEHEQRQGYPRCTPD